MKTAKLTSCLCLGLFLTLLTAAAPADGPKPKHVNRAIELLQQGQPIYYTGSHSGTAGTFEQSPKHPQTSADISATTWNTRLST